MSRDPRDWQKDMNVAQSVKEHGFNDGLPSGELPDIAIYWLQYAEKWKVPYNVTCELLDRSRERADQAEAQVKQLKEDNARLTCQFTGAEQKYLTQSNVIAELRKQLEIAQLAYEGLREECVTRGEYDSLLQKHTVMTKARKAEKDRADDVEGKAKFWEMEYYASLREFAEYRTLYPLDREDTTNEMDPM